MSSLTAQSWWCLQVYLIVMGLVICPINIPLAASFTRVLKRALIRIRILDAESRLDEWFLPLDLRTAPGLAIILLLITQSINGDIVRLGIVGTPGGAIPYDVLVLFISLAYISIALDSTGALRSLASNVAKRTSKGRSLFVAFYGFWFAIGTIVGNVRSFSLFNATQFADHLPKSALGSCHTIRHRFLSLKVSCPFFFWIQSRASKI